VARPIRPIFAVLCFSGVLVAQEQAERRWGGRKLHGGGRNRGNERGNGDQHGDIAVDADGRESDGGDGVHRRAGVERPVIRTPKWAATA